MLTLTKESKSRTEITPKTLTENPERIYKQIDKLIEKLDVDPISFVDAIAKPYVERCIKKNPNYEVERLQRENEQLRKLLSAQGVDPNSIKTSTPF